MGGAIFGFHIGKVGKVPRIGELVEVYHNPIRVFAQHITDEIGTDKATAAGY